MVAVGVGAVVAVAVGVGVGVGVGVAVTPMNAEKVAKELGADLLEKMGGDEWLAKFTLDCLELKIAQALRDARNEALEEAAKLAEETSVVGPKGEVLGKGIFIADDIRALKEDT